MTPKEEAEKNWAIYDRLAGIEDSNPSSISYASREAYKAAANAAYAAANEKNQKVTSDICRKYLTKAVMEKIKSLKP